MKEIKIKALNTSIFIDDLNEITDGKIRVYDSRKEYLDYYEEISFENEQEYLDEIERLQAVKTVQELLYRFSLYENKDYEIVDDFEMGDCVNIIGNIKILFF